jgi:hypothetical protein
MGGGHRTEYDEAIRYPVRFSSAGAARDFHAALEESDREPYTDEGGFVVLLIAGGGRDVYHETQHYNAQVRRSR